MLIDVSTMMQQSKFDIVTVGHFAIDTVSSPMITQTITSLGGPPTFVSVAAARLGAKVSVISKVGRDFPKEYRDWLQSNKVDLSGLKQVEGGLTTRFSLKYQSAWKRRMQLKARAPPITVNDIPSSLRTQAIHIAPVAEELPIETVAKLRKLTCILSLDPQGFVRNFTTRGNTQPKTLATPSVLELADIYKSSSDEIRMVTGIASLKEAARKIHDYGVKIVIVTQGTRGSMLLIDGAFLRVPTCNPRALVDPTGAGDSYIGAFLAEYTRGENPFWCACVGSAMASFVVENLGPLRFGDREETYARAREIYEKHT